MFWEDIVGHEAVISVLRRLVARGSVPHALLFTGAAGIGKGMLAMTLAASVLCKSKSTVPCGECIACKRAAAGTHPDIFRFESNGESLKIEQMRELQNAAALSPVFGNRRVVLLEDAQRLTLPAANSLLKILEEPNESLLFILTAGSTHTLLSTIISRCRVIKLAPVSVEALTSALIKRGYAPAAAEVAARLSGGRLGYAMSMLAPGGMESRAKALLILRHIPRIQTLSGWNAIINMEGSETEDLVGIIGQLLCLLRDMLIIVSGCDHSLLYNADIAAELTDLSATWSERGIKQAVRESLEASRALTGNANNRLTCEALLLRLNNYHAAS